MASPASVDAAQTTAAACADVRPALTLDTQHDIIDEGTSRIRESVEAMAYHLRCAADATDDTVALKALLEAESHRLALDHALVVTWGAVLGPTWERWPHLRSLLIEGGA